MKMTKKIEKNIKKYTINGYVFVENLSMAYRVANFYRTWL